jgi:methylated-DNA-[protein]-cysteine S-methyltransferase
MGTTGGFEREIKAGRIVPGMSFNQRVWAVTARIPAGQVRTYAWVARELGTRAYRAVGNALNRNPYVPTVPCHRVVGSNGSLTGFAGGLQKKRKMLAAEGVEFRNGRVRNPDEDELTPRTTAPPSTTPSPERIEGPDLGSGI